MKQLLQEILIFPFLQRAFLAGLLASVCCGIIGSYITVKRITAIAGSISHTVLMGIGIAVLLSYKVPSLPLSPLGGAVFIAIASALYISFSSFSRHARIDSTLSSMWSVGMAVGILCLYVTPGFNQDLSNYLFGNILMVNDGDLFWIFILDIAIILLVILFFNQFFAICFDEEFSRLRGVSVGFFYSLLLLMTALTIVLLVQIVGTVLVLALLTLPAATAGLFTKRLATMMILAILFSALASTGGLLLSYEPDLPPGPVIILSSAFLYMVMAALKKIYAITKKNFQKIKQG